MCFHAPLFTKKQIAKEDIIVWKDGWLCKEDKDTFRTSVMNYVYRINVPQPKIKLKRSFEFTIFPICKMSVDQGYHSFVAGPQSDFRYVNEAVAKCIIPKGTAYYTNGNVCVSETITVIEIV